MVSVVCFYKSTHIKYLVAVPCDEHGLPLQKINGSFPEPPPPKPKAADDWSPFESRKHFEMAEFLYTRARMSAGNIDRLMTILTGTPNGEPLFRDHSDVYNTIDASELGDVQWQSSTFRYQGEKPDDHVPKWMTVEYEILYRNPRDVIKNMIADMTFKHAFDYAPYQEFDEDGDRRYENFMSGDWAFHQAVCFLLYRHLSADAMTSTEHHCGR